MFTTSSANKLGWTSRRKRGLAQPGTLVLLLLIGLLSGCTGEPEIHVTPTELDFDSTKTVLQLSISNVGDEKGIFGSDVELLEYSVTPAEPWIAANPPGGACGKGESDQIDVTIDTTLLSIGDNTGSITVSSNGGGETIRVKALKSPPPETVSTPDIPTGPSQGEVGESLTFSTGGSVSNLGHDVQYRFVWETGDTSTWSGSASASHSWSTPGTKSVRAQARCATHTTIVSNWSPAKTVTITAIETVSTPNTPTGPPAGEVGQNLTFNTGGSVSSLEDPVEYRFDWGDGEYSDWSSSTSASHSWSAEGTYCVKAQARCATHISVESGWSDCKSVSIQSCTISPPYTPTGPSITCTGEGTYSTGGSVSSCGNPVQYQFDFGDGVSSPWSLNTIVSHTWPSPGTYCVKARARDATNTSVVSSWSSCNIVTVQTETVSEPNTPIGASSGSVGESLSYITSGSISICDHPVQYRFDWGDGNYSTWSSATSASHSWSAPGTYCVKAQARCATHTSILSDWSDCKNVAVEEETVSTPNTPSGPSSGSVGEYLTFNTGGSVSNLGDNVQYRFVWETGDTSGWSGSASTSHSWSTSGTKYVKAQARCATHTNIASSWSSAKTVIITIDETVSTPNTPTGPSTGKVGEYLTFNTGGSVSNLGDNVQYRFVWETGDTSSWSGSASTSHSWSTSGTKYVKAQARCATHHDIVSQWSMAKQVSIEEGCQLDVTVPWGGSVDEGWRITIQWNYSDACGSTVRIDLYKGISTNVYAIAPSTPNDGTHQWSVTDRGAGASSDYRVKITDLATGNYAFSECFAINTGPFVDTSVAIADAFISTSTPDDNVCEGSNLLVGFDEDDETWSLVRFNPPDYEPLFDQKIVKAELVLTRLHYTGSPQVIVCAVAGSWGECSVTINNMPNKDCNPNKIFNAYGGSSPKEFVVDVTDIVKQWYSGSSNYGFYLAPWGTLDNLGYVHFYSSEYGYEPSFRPKLRITYLLE